MSLTLAHAQHPDHYWLGGRYELSLTFDPLSDAQWKWITKSLWDYPMVNGPLADRFSPGSIAPDLIAPLPPDPASSAVYYAQLAIDNLLVGAKIQITRALFECVSVQVPLAMFDGIADRANVRALHPDLARLDNLLLDWAFALFEDVSFQIAAVGYERGCQLTDDLRSNGQARHDFLLHGNFLIREDILSQIDDDHGAYHEVATGLFHRAFGL